MGTPQSSGASGDVGPKRDSLHILRNDLLLLNIYFRYSTKCFWHTVVLFNPYNRDCSVGDFLHFKYLLIASLRLFSIWMCLDKHKHGHRCVWKQVFCPQRSVSAFPADTGTLGPKHTVFLL